MSSPSPKLKVPSFSPSDLLAVKIQTPEGIIWEGSAEVISSRNSAGPFDILPDHANMITLVEGSPISIITGSESQDYLFEKAVISVENNKVSIFSNITKKTATDKTVSN